MADNSFLDKRSRSLEDTFYLEHDRALIERLREMRKMEENIRNLAEVSGIKDEAVLKKLVALNIHAESLASLAMVPLVEVAWADGRIDKEERDALLKATADGGMFSRIDRSLLEQWLSHKPKPELLVAWEQYTAELCKVLSETERRTLRQQIMARAESVAEAAGGFLGLTSKISADERAVLERMARAFGF
jgi:tellurite resistance protein